MKTEKAKRVRIPCKRVTATVQDIIDNGHKLLSRLNIVGECMEFTGGITYKGYGNFHVAKRLYLMPAHRAAYILKHGEIPHGMCVCHSCDNRKCCNPDHLWLGTNTDNHIDKALKKRGRKSLLFRFIGVRFRKDTNKWSSYVCYDKKIINTGTFKTEIEAASARNKYIIDNGLTLKVPQNEI